MSRLTDYEYRRRAREARRAERHESTRAAAEGRELRRRAEELRVRAEDFRIDGMETFAADALRLQRELCARADRLDPPPPMFVPANPGRFMPPREASR